MQSHSLLGCEAELLDKQFQTVQSIIVLQYKEKGEFFSWTAWTWWWWHNILSKCQKLLSWWYSTTSWETRIFKNTHIEETHIPKPRDGEEKWKSSKKPSRSESRSNIDLAELLATLLGLSCSIVFMSLNAEWLTPLQTEINIRNKCTSYIRLLIHRQKLPRSCKSCFFKLHDSMYCFWAYSAHLIHGGEWILELTFWSEIHLHIFKS